MVSSHVDRLPPDWVGFGTAQGFSLVTFIRLVGDDADCAIGRSLDEDGPCLSFVGAGLTAGVTIAVSAAASPGLPTE